MEKRPLLHRDVFLSIVKNAPLVSVDLVCQNDREEVLLGMRMNRPAQGCWFVPGGRILKDERVSDALQRIISNELGLKDVAPNDAGLLGVFEHHYTDNFAEAADVSTHYVVLAYKIVIDKEATILIDSQHSELRWFSVSELLSSDVVHTYTKAYFDESIKITRAP